MCPVGRVGIWERSTTRSMRLIFALCAGALLLAAPTVHGLRLRDPAKLVAGPQSVIGTIGFLSVSRHLYYLDPRWINLGS